ncbi:hypothetical protein JCM8208_002009 [Rhodotorula glutinis]
MQREAFVLGPPPPAPCPDLPSVLAALASPQEGALLIAAVVAGSPSAAAAAQLLRQATQRLTTSLGITATSLAAIQAAAYDRLEVARREGDRAAEAEWQALLREIEVARDSTAGTLSANTLQRNAASRRGIRTALGLAEDAVIYTAGASLPVQRDTWAGIAGLAALCQQRIAREALPYRPVELFYEAMHAVDRRAGLRWGTAAAPHATSRLAGAAPASSTSTVGVGAGEGAGPGGDGDELDRASGSGEPGEDEGTGRGGRASSEHEDAPPSDAGDEPGEVARLGRPPRSAAAKRVAPPAAGSPPAPPKKKRGRPFKVFEPGPTSTSSARAGRAAAGRGQAATQEGEAWDGDDLSGTILGALSLLGAIRVDLDVLIALPAALERLAPELESRNRQLATPPPEGRPAPALAAFARALSPDIDEGPPPPRRRGTRTGEGPGVEQVARLLQGVGLGPSI